MTTVAPWISSGAAQLAAQGIDGIGQQAAQVRGLWQEIGWGWLDEPEPQSESSLERGLA